MTLRNETYVQAESNGGLPVNIQDQTTPVLIVPLNRVENTTTTAANLSIGDNTITISNTTGFVGGKLVIIASASDNRYYVGRQIGAPVGNVITVDTPIDFPYDSGTQITAGTFNIAVNGSITPQVFSLRAADDPPGVPIEVDVTRLIFQCQTVDQVDFSKLGDIVGGITNGIVLRKVNNTYNNIFNVKTNGELAALMFDFNVQSATNPAQGQNGFIARMTFAGQNKMGVTVRVGPGEDLEMIVQDDLSGITELIVICEGHVVTD